MPKFLSAVANFGIDATVAAEEAKYVRVLNSNVFVVIPLVLAYAFFFLIFAPETSYMVILGFTASPLFCLVFALHAAKLFRTARIFAPVLSTSVITLASVILGQETDFHYFLMSTIVAVFFTFPRAQKRSMYGMIGFQAASFVALQFWFLHFPALQPVRASALPILQFIAAGGIFFLIMGFSFYVFSIYRAAESELETEKARSEALLLNILPAPIAERLKQHQGRIADRFEEATVLFTDLVNFTKLSERLSPEDLIAVLDNIFSEFDALVDKHKVEKIKTIGDSYMVVAGLPSRRPDHAEAMADLAIDMLRTISEVEQTHNLKIRIGIHSGPVVAGVIGKRKFTYDLWGDSVNTASRMESHGTEGKIHVTENVYQRLKNDFILEPRGTMEIKGKGQMVTYFLESRR